MTGPYRIGHLAIHNRVVLTNKTPTGLNRGFGGPQVYFALERLVHRIAKTLGLDPIDVVRRNLVPAQRVSVPRRVRLAARLRRLPETALDIATGSGRLRSTAGAACSEARAAGRRYGIGFAAVVEPSISNMGYITTALTAAERERAGPKDGAAASATVSIDPLGSITALVASAPQGQGHRTVIAQVVAEALGVALGDVTVNVEHDTQKDPWSIAAGNYSSRFSGRGGGRRASRGDEDLRDRLARIAGSRLNVAPEALGFADGAIFAADNPENAVLARRGPRASLTGRPAALPDGVEPGFARDRVLVDARTRSAGRGRSGEQLGRLRLHLRHVRGGGRRHRPGPHRRVRHHARRRHPPESRVRRRADPRRVRARRGRGAVRGARLRRRRRLPVRDVRGLPRSHRVRGAGPRPSSTWNRPRRSRRWGRRESARATP